MAFRSPFQILELFNKNPAVRIGSVYLLFLEIQNIVPEFLRKKNGMIYCVSVLLQSVVTTVFMHSDFNLGGRFSSLTLCMNCTSLNDINNKRIWGLFFSVSEDKILGMQQCSVHLFSAFCLFSRKQDTGITLVIINRVCSARAEFLLEKRLVHIILIIWLGIKCTTSTWSQNREKMEIAFPYMYRAVDFRIANSPLDC